MSDYFGKEMPKLGFGLMRLPKLNGDEEKIDVEQVKQMVDLFLGAGQRYFDTAYVYDDGRSEEAIKAALVDRYPRDSYKLATKLCAWLQCDDEASAKQQFYTSLKRTGAGYFDFYLLHALQTTNYKKYDEYHLWDFVKELKAKGLVKHWGFSFHATPELLDEILTPHPDVDFVQLQLNYFDWESPYVASRECYEVCARHGKQAIVMEPVKGGALASLPEGCLGRLRRVDPDASPASWAIRFAASLDDVLVVLSGMSDMAQMRDNTSFMEDFVPLGEAERAAVADVATELRRGMRYDPSSLEAAQDACPKGIGIVKIAQMMNDHLRMGGRTNTCIYYDTFLGDAARASACDDCGRCAGLSGDVDVPAMLREADETITHF